MGKFWKCLFAQPYPARMAAVAVACLGWVCLFAGEPELRLDIGLTSAGLGKAPLASALWGFESDRLSARVRLLNIDFAASGPIAASNCQFELRSPYLELGSFAPPEAWSALAGSPSAVECLMPGRIQNFTESLAFTKTLPLSFSSLGRSDPVRSLGVGLGLPNYLSAMLFRQFSGEDSGWTHAGVYGQYPIPIALSDKAADRLLVRIGLAYYGSWFAPTTDSGWQIDPSVPGLAEKSSPDWWLSTWMIPAILGHGQVVLTLSGENLRWIVLVQTSAPAAMARGWFGATALEWIIPDAVGKRLANLMAAAYALDSEYRDARGQYPGFCQGFSLGAEAGLGGDWDLSAELSFKKSRPPLASVDREKSVPVQWEWQTGINYLSRLTGFGLELAGKSLRSDTGAWANDQDITLKLKSQGNGSIYGKLAANLGLSLNAGLAKNWLGQAEIGLCLGFASWRLSLAISGGGEWGIGFDTDWLNPKLKIDLRLEVGGKSGLTAELTLGLALPETNSLAAFLAKTQSGWWNGLAKTIGLNLRF